MKARIEAASGSPHELEALYRTDPEEFARALPDALAEQPGSVILQAWQERLFFEAGPEVCGRPSIQWRPRDIRLAVVLALAAGTLAQLPHFFPVMNEAGFYQRNMATIVLGALAVYFCIQRQCRAGTAVAILSTLLGAGLVLNLLPGRPGSQTLVLSCIHMPFLVWSLVGVAFTGGDWRNLRGRMDYLGYNGELVVYSAVILLGGAVLTGLAFALFHLIALKIADWYQRYVAIYGAVAAPIVATLLVDRIVAERLRIAPLLARIFAPLFLVLVAVYLIAMAVDRRSPFLDRNVLSTFNVLLLLVLALCVFSVSERNRSARSIGAVNFSLLSLTLVLDLVALAAILFRLASWGFTPNRLAVLGANILVFGHLGGILVRSIELARRRGSPEGLQRWVAGYLPVYAAWSVLVAIGFPPIFGFR